MGACTSQHELEQAEGGCVSNTMVSLRKAQVGASSLRDRGGLGKGSLSQKELEGSPQVDTDMSTGVSNDGTLEEDTSKRRQQLDVDEDTKRAYRRVLGLIEVVGSSRSMRAPSISPNHDEAQKHSVGGVKALGSGSQRMTEVPYLGRDTTTGTTDNRTPPEVLKVSPDNTTQVRPSSLRGVHDLSRSPKMAKSPNGRRFNEPGEYPKISALKSLGPRPKAQSETGEVTAGFSSASPTGTGIHLTNFTEARRVTKSSPVPDRYRSGSPTREGAVGVVLADKVYEAKAQALNSVVIASELALQGANLALYQVLCWFFGLLSLMLGSMLLVWDWLGREGQDCSMEDKGDSEPYPPQVPQKTSHGGQGDEAAVDLSEREAQQPSGSAAAQVRALSPLGVPLNPLDMQPYSGWRTRVSPLHPEGSGKGATTLASPQVAQALALLEGRQAAGVSAMAAAGTSTFSHRRSFSDPELGNNVGALLSKVLVRKTREDKGAARGTLKDQPESQRGTRASSRDLPACRTSSQGMHGSQSLEDELSAAVVPGSPGPVATGQHMPVLGQWVNPAPVGQTFSSESSMRVNNTEGTPLALIPTVKMSRTECLVEDLDKSDKSDGEEEGRGACNPTRHRHTVLGTHPLSPLVEVPMGISAPFMEGMVTLREPGQVPPLIMDLPDRPPSTEFTFISRVASTGEQPRPLEGATGEVHQAAPSDGWNPPESPSATGHPKGTVLSSPPRGRPSTTTEGTGHGGIQEADGIPQEGQEAQGVLLGRPASSGARAALVPPDRQHHVGIAPAPDNLAGTGQDVRGGDEAMWSAREEDHGGPLTPTKNPSSSSTSSSTDGSATPHGGGFSRGPSGPSVMSPYLEASSDSSLMEISEDLLRATVASAMQMGPSDEDKDLLTRRGESPQRNPFSRWHQVAKGPEEGSGPPGEEDELEVDLRTSQSSPNVLMGGGSGGLLGGGSPPVGDFPMPWTLPQSKSFGGGLGWETHPVGSEGHQTAGGEVPERSDRRSSKRLPRTVGVGPHLRHYAGP